jgi:hypothetical protein
MTISVNGNPTSYTGTGGNPALSTVFVFFADSDVIVTQRVTATGAETTMVLGEHYTLSGGSASGAVGTVTPIAGGTDFTTAMTWTIERAVPLTQELDYVENDTFPAASHEQGMDRLTTQSQDDRAQVTRALRFPITDAASLTSQLPDSVTRASKVLSFDANGNVTVSTPTSVGYGKVLLDSEDAAASATVEMLATNWPATYDRIELELVNVLSASGTLLTLKPIDNGSATTTNLNSQIMQSVAGTVTDSDNADWQLNTAAGTGTDDVISGSAMFTYNGGFLNGVGNWTYRSTSNHISNWVSYQRHTTIGTQWDGIEVSFSAGNITSGSIRLWGLPKL